MLALAVALPVGVPVGMVVAQDDDTPSDPPSDEPAASPLAEATLPEPGELRIGVTSELGGADVNPITAFDVGGIELATLQYAKLTDFSDADFSLVGDLAEAWDTNDERTRVEYTLREGLTWSDGTPLTADDAAYTINRSAQERWPTHVPVTEFLSAIALDERTLIVESTRPDPDLPALSVRIYPQHVLADLSTFSALEAWDGRSGAVSGPFVLDEVESERRWSLVPNPSWHGWADVDPPLERIRFFTYDDDRLALEALRLGLVDAVDDLPAEFFEAIDGSADAEAVAGFKGAFWELGINNGASGLGNGSPALLDLRVRQAIAHAIDRPTLVRIGLQQLGLPRSVVVPSVDPYWSVGLDQGEGYDFDLERARKLLDEAGWVDGDGDGIRNDPATGEPLILRYAERSRTSFEPAVGDLIRGWLGQIGVDTVVEPFDQDAELADTILAGEFDLFVWNWAPTVVPDRVLSFFRCSQVSSLGDDDRYNSSNYCNPEFDELFDAQRGELDRDLRREQIAQLARILRDDVAHVVLFAAADLQAHRTDRFVGWTRQPRQVGPILFNESARTYENLRPIDQPASGAVSRGFLLTPRDEGGADDGDVDVTDEADEADEPPADDELAVEPPTDQSSSGGSDPTGEPSDTADAGDDEGEERGTDWGLWIVGIVGALLVVIGGVLAWRRRRPGPPPSTPPSSSDPPPSTNPPPPPPPPPPATPPQDGPQPPAGAWDRRIARRRPAMGSLAVLALAGAATAAVAAPPSASAQADVDADADFVVSPDGDDGGAGTIDDPFATLGHAVEVAPSGSTILLLDGTYHESVQIYDEALTIEGESRDGVVFDGAVEVTDWTEQDGRWSTPFDLAGERAGTPWVLEDDQVAGYPELAFVDGVPLDEVATLDEVGPGTFFNDVPNAQLWIGDDPADALVEVSDLQFALYFNEAADSVLRNVTVRRYATPKADMAAVRAYGDRMLVENVWFEENAFAGLSAIGDQITLRGIDAHRNGQNGLHGHETTDLLIEGANVTGNNTEGFDPAWATAGIKVTTSPGLVVRESYVADNVGPGVWTDLEVRDGAIVSNLIEGNTRSAIEIELSGFMVVADNVGLGNGEAGVYVLESNDVDVWNNAFVGNTPEIRVFEGNRDVPPDRDDRVEWEVRRVNLFNNLIGPATGDEQVLVGIDGNLSNKPTGEVMGVVADNNRFWRRADSGPVSLWMGQQDTFPTASDDLDAHRIQTGGQDTNSQLVESDDDPYSIDPDAGDWGVDEEGAGARRSDRVAEFFDADDDTLPPGPTTTWDVGVRNVDDGDADEDDADDGDGDGDADDADDDEG